MTELKTSERLYNVNAHISGHFLTGLHKATQQDMMKINQALGTLIGEVRELEKNQK